MSSCLRAAPSLSAGCSRRHAPNSWQGERPPGPVKERPLSVVKTNAVGPEGSGHVLGR